MFKMGSDSDIIRMVFRMWMSLEDGILPSSVSSAILSISSVILDTEKCLERATTDIEGKMERKKESGVVEGGGPKIELQSSSVPSQPLGGN